MLRIHSFPQPNLEIKNIMKYLIKENFPSKYDSAPFISFTWHLEYTENFRKSSKDNLERTLESPNQKSAVRENLARPETTFTVIPLISGWLRDISRPFPSTCDLSTPFYSPLVPATRISFQSNPVRLDHCMRYLSFLRLTSQNKLFCFVSKTCVRAWLQKGTEVVKVAK